jgi:type II secretory pathway component PulJ
MPTKDMKATQTNRTTLELLALVMISGLLLLAAFSMMVQMDIEMNAQEVNAPIAEFSATSAK